MPVQLDPGVDAALRLREDWSHKQGTPETHERLNQGQTGALARLHASGAISDDQLRAAVQISDIVEMIGADVNVRTASLETRVDRGRRGTGVFYEQLAQVQDEIAYSRWRANFPHMIAPLLAVIVEDIGIVRAAERHRVGVKRLRKVLGFALDLWSREIGHVCATIDEDELQEAHARLLS